jgi:predicted MFS family arabinose efflux permease
MAALGRAIGPVAAVAIATPDGSLHATDAVFVAGAAIAVIALVVARLIPSTASESHEPQEPADVRLWESIRQPGMRPALLAGITSISCVTLLVAYLPAYGQERGLPPESIGLALAALPLSQIVARVNLGFIERRLGYAVATAGSMLVAAIALPFLSLPLGMVGLVCVMVVVGAGLGLGQPLSLVWFAAMMPRHVRAAAMGVRTTGQQFGQLVVPAVAGVVAGRAGVIGVTAFMSLLLLAAAGDVTASRRTLNRASPLRNRSPAGWPGEDIRTDDRRA